MRAALMSLLRRWSVLGRLSELPGPIRLIVLGQLAFNTGFYLVLPFFALHLTRDLGFGGALVGLLLGLRTFSQQGLFFLGGALADRFGTRPVRSAGCPSPCTRGHSPPRPAPRATSGPRSWPARRPPASPGATCCPRSSAR